MRYRTLHSIIIIIFYSPQSQRQTEKKVKRIECDQMFNNREYRWINVQWAILTV